MISRTEYDALPTARGRWRFTESTVVIPEAAIGYEIPIADFANEPRCDFWIDHMRGKSWVTYHDVNDLIFLMETMSERTAA